MFSAGEYFAIKKTMKAIWIFAVLLSTTRLFAQFLPDQSDSSFRSFLFFAPTWEGSYLIPNESNPEALTPALKEAPSGIYLTVGTERSFFGAVLAKNITHLLVVDLDPQVKAYNEINRAFLIYSDTPKILAFMKFTRNFDEWLIAKDDLIQRGYHLEASALNLYNFKKYQNTIWGSPNGFDNQLKIFFEEDAKNNRLYETNYLFHDPAFRKLKKMAEDRRMQFEVGNFANSEYIAALVRSIQEAQLKIGVVDLSNMYSGYIGPRNLAETLLELTKASHKNTVLVGTMMTFTSYFYTHTWVDFFKDGYSLSRFISYLEKYSKYYAAKILGSQLRTHDSHYALMQFSDFESEFSINKKETPYLTHIEFIGSCHKYFM